MVVPIHGHIGIVVGNLMGKTADKMLSIEAFSCYSVMPSFALRLSLFKVATIRAREHYVAIYFQTDRH